jgi:hypothetical protein
VAFQTDRDFKLTINESQVSWGKPAISGSALYDLAKPNDGDAVFMVIRGGNDRQIEPNEAVDLTLLELSTSSLRQSANQRLTS